jgi:hypothetical protein
VIGIRRERVWKDLDRDVTIEPRVARAIHLAHATGAEHVGNFIGAETATAAQHRSRL